MQDTYTAKYQAAKDALQALDDEMFSPTPINGAVEKQLATAAVAAIQAALADPTLPGVHAFTMRSELASVNRVLAGE